MTGKPSTSRPYDATPYAELRQTEATANSLRTSLAAPSTASGELKAEAEKLSRLRDALWMAFEAGAEAGLPNTLIDLTMAYTGALRLQLSLKALTGRQRNAEPVARPPQKPSAQ